jgi:NodT family efflux transporter outer membrane factor (OMF) lipoprotein
MTNVVRAPLVGPMASSRWMSRAVATLTTVALISGCAVGPNFRRPAAPAVDSYTRPSMPGRTASVDVTGGEEQRLAHGQDVPHNWWTLFQSPELNALVDRALKASPTLVAAQQALRQAMALVDAQRGAFYPTVQGSFSPSYQRSSATLAPPLNTTELRYALYTAQVTVGFTPDVFGGNRRQVESLLGQAEAQRFQLEAAYVTLTSNVVAAAVQEASLRAQISATREIIAIVTRSLELVRRQFQFGAVSGLEVAQQETALAQVQQTLLTLQKQLEQNRNLLAALSARFPSDDPEETFDLALFRLPTDLPVSVPSRLVEQRPDVRASEAQLHAASAQIGVAVASQLPQFTITGAYGGTSTVITQMFATGNPFWSVAGSIAQTIFDAGTLIFRRRAAEAAFEQVGAQYRSTVITAFQNVADALSALKVDAESLKAAVAAERAAKRTLDITLKQQEFGAVNYLALLSAQQAYQQTLVVRVQAQASRLADTAALFQALGGGWWNRPVPAPTTARSGDR